MASGHLSGDEATDSQGREESSWGYDEDLPDTASDDSSPEKVAPKPSRKHRRSAARPAAAATQQPEADRSQPSPAPVNSNSQQERPDARDAETGLDHSLQSELVEQLAPQVTGKGKQVTDKFVRDGLSRFKRNKHAARKAKWPSVGELQRLIKERRDELRKAANS